MLEPTKYPLFVLFVNVPFEMVDVNIHPRKEQVSFVNNQYIFTTIKQAITDVLQENNITFQNLSWLRNGVGTTNSFAGRLLRQEVLEKEKFTPDFTQTFLQLDKLYIIVPTKKGLFLIDQHAAHERILFEKLSEEFIKQKNKQKKFKLPKTLQIQLSFSEQLLLKENKRLFEKLGFIFKQSTQTSEITMKQFNNKAIVLTHIPILFQDRNMQQLIQEIIEELQTEKPIKDIDSVTFEMLAFLACRAAVKAGDNLSEKQMKEIVEKLETSPNNITCPHGRPTRILITKEEIDNLFKR